MSSFLYGDFTDRSVRDLHPTVSYQINQKTTGSINASYQSVSFPNPGTTGLIDFAFNSVSATLQRTLTERQSISVSTFRSEFEANDVQTKTTTLGVGLGYSYQYSPTLSGTVSGSLRTSELESQRLPQATRENGFTANASVAKSYERGEVTTTISRDLSPTSSGFLIQRDELAFRWKHKFRDYVTGILEMRYEEDSSLGSSSTSEDQQRLRLAARLRLRLARDWNLVGAYRLLRRERDSRPDPAKSNAVWLAIHYRPIRQPLGW